MLDGEELSSLEREYLVAAGGEISNFREEETPTNVSDEFLL